MPLLIAAAILATIAAFLLTNSASVSAAIPPPSEGTPPMLPSLKGTWLPEWEQTMILSVAQDFGIDAALLAAMRQTENGPILDDGTRGFGVLDPRARVSYRTNAEWSARTIRNTQDRYVRAYSLSPLTHDGRATDAFLEYLSLGGPGYPGYAPLGVANDPDNLNKNHLTNLRNNYANIAVV